MGQLFIGGDIQEIVDTCGGISRNELANTVCELLDWKRIGGGLKTRECKDLLEQLEDKGVLKLPEKRKDGYTGPRKSVAKVRPDAPYSALTGSVEDIAPLDVQRVRTREQRDLFQDLLARYHYLGYAMPFGARIQYLVLAFIRNLASAMLACSLRRLKSDWQEQYGLAPLLVETLVDRKRFHGGCYRAGNWIELGETSGRGRMDKANQRHGAAVKTILVYPLVKNAARCLRDGR